MLIPLPDELKEILDELNECGPYVDDNQYDADQHRSLEKLRILGLVAVGWVMTPAGHRRLRERAED